MGQSLAADQFQLGGIKSGAPGEENLQAESAPANLLTTGQGGRIPVAKDMSPLIVLAEERADLPQGRAAGICI
jgi:hypothetical protein